MSWHTLFKVFFTHIRYRITILLVPCPDLVNHLFLCIYSSQVEELALCYGTCWRPNPPEERSLWVAVSRSFNNSPEPVQLCKNNIVHVDFLVWSVTYQQHRIWAEKWLHKVGLLLINSSTSVCTLQVLQRQHHQDVWSRDVEVSHLDVSGDLWRLSRIHCFRFLACWTHWATTFDPVQSLRSVNNIIDCLPPTRITRIGWMEP